jgi:tRNA threonylcarbamoyladenosine biosynthesis protein TsaE
MTGDGPAGAVSIELADEAATRALAARLAVLARRGDVFALAGGLGSGKTVFARAFVAARAAAAGAPAEDVPSPTFTLVQTYDFADGMVYHFDLYRLAGPDETSELDIEDAFADGISLIEWPDRLGPLLPAGRLDVELLPGPRPEARRARLAPHGDWTARLKEAGLA